MKYYHSTPTYFYTVNTIKTNSQALEDLVNAIFGLEKPNPELSDVQARLNKAVADEDFELAIKIREEKQAILNKIEEQKSKEQKIKELEKQIDSLVKDEKFEECVPLRDEIKALKAESIEKNEKLTEKF